MAARPIVIRDGVEYLDYGWRDGVRVLSQRRRKSTRPRDSQRAKLYAAEQAAALDVPIHDEPYRRWECATIQTYVDRLVASAWFMRRFPRTGSIKVKDGRATTRPAGGHGKIWLPRHCRDWWIVLHEIAHVVTEDEHGGYTHANGVAWHGPEFVAAYIALVQHELGPEAAFCLIDACRAKRVRIGRRIKPRTARVAA